VQVDPQKLQAKNVTLTQLIDTTGNALWVSPLSFVEASTPGTGGFVETPNQRLGVQHVSPIVSSKQLADVAVEGTGTGAAPVRLGDVTSVVEDHQPLIGGATDAGQQSLMLVVERFPGANTAQVTHDLEDALAEMEPGLKGITVDTSVYQPVRYLDSALHRVGIAALVGLILMVLVIGVLGRTWRVAVVSLASVATSVTAALWVLYLRGDTLTSMTLMGVAAAMALVIDDAVGDVGELRSRLRGRQDDGQSATVALLTEAVGRRRGPLLYATLITLLGLAPLFLLTGPPGALVRPATTTFVLAVLASLLVALIATPVLTLLLVGGREPGRTRFGRSPAWARRGLDGLTARSVGRPLVAGVVLAVLALLAVPGIVVGRHGSTLATAEDRSLVVRLQASPGTGLGEMSRITTAAAAELQTLSGVRTAGTHVGRAIASDQVTDVNTSEVWVTVADDADYNGTLEAIRSTIRGYPGLRSEVQTYEAQQLAAAGVTTGDKLVVRVYGQDLATLQKTAEDVRQEMQTVSGVISPRAQTQVTVPTVEIKVDLAAAQKVGLRPGDVRRDASTLISGLTVGSIYQDQAIFDVVLWGGAASRSSVTTLGTLLIDTPSGQRVPLGSVATVAIAPDPTAITHDAVSRSLDVTAEVHGRSAADVAQDVTAHLRGMTFPYEYRAEVVGDASTRASNAQWILIAALAVAVLAYLLLQSATGSWRGAAVLLVTVPFAGVGGLLAALFAGGLLSGSVLAAIAVAVALALRQALVLVRRAQVHRGEREAGESMRLAVRETAPPVIGVALATGALFLPAAVMGGGPGLELLQPFAVSLLLGLISTVVVVLFVLPSLYPVLAGLRPLPVAPDAASNGRHADPAEASHPEASHAEAPHTAAAGPPHAAVQEAPTQLMTDREEER
jgi:Cu/Ag efflux pump CusA